MSYGEVCNNIYDLIGASPMVRLRKLSASTRSDVYAKLEYFNPGQSVKDRIVRYMIEEAEKEGKLRPGDTIVEATSGNTGFSLAMIAAARGYKCILTVKSSISPEKYKAMKALGAEIVKCPAGVAGDDPDSYYETAKRICRDTPNCFYLNQNFDLGNTEAHYLTTGPEIWNQMAGQLTHFIACASTGGTISGTARYLKEKDPDIEIIAVDACTGVLKHYHETGEFCWQPGYSTRLEGVGKNIIPDNVNFDLIDRFVAVEDEDSAYSAKYLASEEGIFSGYSSGAAMAGLEKIANTIPSGSTIALLFPDHGSRYLNKIYDPAWMRSQGFLNGREVLKSAPKTHI